MSEKRATVVLLIIGNEILSGRTQEKNLPELAALLGKRGLRLCEARVVADIEADIVAALNALRARYDYVFTSGGIGPTHDDITTDSVAAAFGVPIIENADAIKKLTMFYQDRDLPFTQARRRMARFPQPAKMIDSGFPGAPAYRIDNVIVCAGVPAIFSLMAEAAMAGLPQATLWQSSTVRVLCGESIFAEALATLAAEYPLLELGSYPRNDGGMLNCHVVFSGEHAAAIDEAKAAFMAYLERKNLPFEL